VLLLNASWEIKLVKKELWNSIRTPVLVFRTAGRKCFLVYFHAVSAASFIQNPNAAKQTRAVL